MLQSIPALFSALAPKIQWVIEFVFDDEPLIPYCAPRPDYHDMMYVPVFCLAFMFCTIGIALTGDEPDDHAITAPGGT